MTIAIATASTNRAVGMRVWGNDEKADAHFEQWALGEGYGLTWTKHKTIGEAEAAGWEWVST
jgi:hypothetical protein